MKLIIDISEYDREWIKNTYGIPQDIDVAIARAIINGKALPDKHGRLGDLDALRESVLKWLPPDPCGVEEKERPYETDICVSILMEIEDAPTIVEGEGET